MMKGFATIAFCLLGGFAIGQSDLTVNGNLYVHQGGKLGLFGNLNNNGSLIALENSLIGVYGNSTVNYNGNSNLSAYDMETMVAEGFFLNQEIRVRNNLNLIEGFIITNNRLDLPMLSFDQEAFYSGEDLTRHIIGFARMENKSIFTFPVGDGNRLRGLTFESGSPVEKAECAYFAENPSAPLSYNEQFNTEELTRAVGAVSTYEFWVLKSTNPGMVTVSWDTDSRLNEIANIPEDLILVGWNISAGQWTSLGQTQLGGDLEEGFLTSESFDPNQYGAITFGVNPFATDTFAVNVPTLGDYFISPNGDNINDALIFKDIQGIANNELYIFNKFGQKVFEFKNYSNEFVGIGNSGSFYVGQGQGLPEGLYYYLIKLREEGLEYFGILYIDR